MGLLKDTYGTLNDGYLAFCTLRGPKDFCQEGWYSIGELDEMEHAMLERSAEFSTYYTFHVAKEPTNRRRENFFASVGMLFDVDLMQADSKLHSKNDVLPGSIEEVLDLISQCDLPEPTRIINSGNGLYLHYLFEEPVLYPHEADRVAFEKKSAAMHRAFHAAFKANNRHLDNISDLARVTRLPGTLNHKGGYKKPVSVVASGGPRLELAQFKAFLPAPVPAVRLPQSGMSARAVARTGVDLGTKAAAADFRAVYAGCAWVGDVTKRAEALSYPEWFALGGLLKHCDEGGSIFHELSQRDQRYDQKEAEGLFASVNGPTTCGYIEQSTSAEVCGSCVFRGNRHFGSPVRLGNFEAHEAAFLSSFAYVVRRELFFRSGSKEQYTKTNINDMYTRYLGKAPANLFLNEKIALSVEDAAYLPGQTDPFPVYHGKRVFNLWRGSDLVPVAGDVSTVLEHLEYLVPEPSERGHVFNCLAHVVQRPTDKIKHGLFFLGGQGTGKSWLTAMLSRLFGPHNVYVAENELLRSEFNAPMANRQILVLEEVGLEDRAEVYESLKTWITSETRSVNQKHEKHYEATTPRLIIAFSNNQVPIKIPPDDRRFFFVGGPQAPRDSQYYDRLFSEGLDQAAAFLDWLLKLDISGFHPDARPPMTLTKQDIILSSMPVAEAELRRMVSAKEWPFSQELFTLDSVTEELRMRLNVRADVSARRVGEALRKLGFGKPEAEQVRIPPSNRPLRFWVKAGSNWEQASPEELRAQWVAQGSQQAAYRLLEEGADY